MKILTKLAYAILKSQLSPEYHAQFIQKKGSTYGCWMYCSCPEHLPSKTLLLSAGVGEDISFDTELIHEHSVKTILIDPVVRATIHVQEYLQNKVKNLTPAYTGNGRREILEYICTSKIQEAIILERFALWGKNEKVGLLPPQNDDFVSYSRVNLQKDSKLYFFDGVDISTILKRNEEFIGDFQFNILKLDIEGSELDFLEKDTEWQQSLQILVEFDIFRNLKFRNFIKFILILRKFKKNHYILIKIEKFNTLWLKKK